MVDSASVVRVILSCLAVCGLVWLWGWWLRRFHPLTAPLRRHLRLLEMLSLGGGHRIALVACDDRRFLLALFPQGVQVLAELSPTDQLPQEEHSPQSLLSAPTNSTAQPSNGKETKSEHSFPVRWNLPFLCMLAILLLVPTLVTAQSPNPQAQLSLMRESVQILMLLTLIALAPFLLSVMTCFTRVVIVLSLLRVAMGTPQTPPNPVVIGMGLFLTMFVMAPTLQEANERGLQPFLQNKLSLEQAVIEGYKPFQRFMLRQVREKDIALFLRIAKLPNPRTPDEVPAYILIPAFILSEVRTGFEIGFLIAIPFLVVDLVIASVLMGMGMLMVPPMLISLPLKLLLFVLADGWHLLMRGLALSVR